jgi:hypothetical protein
MKQWIPPTLAKVLVTAKTYPSPARKGVEVSCTGGITEDGRWIRLFPMPFRFLSKDKQFHKYQWIELQVTKASDSRPESFQPILESIRIVSDPLPTAESWQARREIVEPLQSPSLCYLKANRTEHGGSTLGFFKPREIRRLVIEPDSPNWTEAQLARLRQSVMFDNAPTKELEKIPFKFKYEFACDDPSCNGHTISCVDWEMSEAYRSWLREYRDWQSAFRNRFEDDMIEHRDTHFFVGTTREHPGSWIIVGLFYPPHVLERPASTHKQVALL